MIQDAIFKSLAHAPSSSFPHSVIWVFFFLDGDVASRKVKKKIYEVSKNSGKQTTHVFPFGLVLYLRLCLGHGKVFAHTDVTTATAPCSRREPGHRR